MPLGTTHTFKMKMNEQTVFMTLDGSSTLEIVALRNVPVYEPAESGWINYYFHTDTITIVNDNGDATCTNVETGHTMRWYVRPTLANVVNLGVGGYYYEFKKDGSIASSCKEGGTYYWGPVVDVDRDAPIYVGVIRSTIAQEDLMNSLMLEHFHSTDPMEVLKDMQYERAATLLNQRWRQNWSIREEIQDDKEMIADLEKRVYTTRKIRNNPAVLKAYQDAITDLENAIEYNLLLCRKDEEKCSECRRGVCMCYT